MLDKKIFKQIVAVAFWVTAWFIIAYLIGNKLLVASPVDTFRALLRMVKERAFYQAIIKSFLKIFGGFLCGFGVAGILAFLSYKWDIAELIILPFVSLCKSMPVAVFAVVLIIWWGPSNLSFFISTIVVLPVVFNNLLEGLKSTDNRLLQMANVYKLPTWNKAMFIYRSELKPYILSAVKSSIGMSWKAGVAAEVIGLTNNSIGGALYNSKVYFNTDEVFAWACVIILVSFITEKIVVRLTNMLLAIKVRTKQKSITQIGDGSIKISDLCKTFDDKILYKDYSIQIDSGTDYVMSQKSGSGKTTLLNMIAGIVTPDSGRVERTGILSMVFQEDRLCEEYSAVTNVCITGVGEMQARKALEKVLDKDCLDKPCVELSGGMKRRVAIVRAMEYPSDIVLLDEPYTGMDEETIKLVKKYIEETRKARTVIVATHIL